MIDISNLWLLFDALAALFIVLNIFLITKKKYKFCSYFALLSMTSECLALLGEYQQALNAVNEDNVSYILDVIPHIGNIRTPIVLTIIIINICLGLVSLFSKNK